MIWQRQLRKLISTANWLWHARLMMECSSVHGRFPVSSENKNFQNRKAAIVENGSWAPMSGKLMKAYLEGMKNITLVEPTVTIKSTISEKNLEELNALADALLA